MIGSQQTLINSIQTGIITKFINNKQNSVYLFTNKNM